MASVAPILGMSMMAFGLAFFIFCVGGLVYTVVRREGRRINRNSPTPAGVPDGIAGDGSP